MTGVDAGSGAGRDRPGAPTFVVSTGRCGSTMISNMLREHPDILSLSQFFSLISDGSRTPEPFTPEPIDGRRFWLIVSRKPRFINFLLRHEPQRPAEVAYAYEASTSRFSAETGVPGILLSTLPHLVDDPHPLYDALADIMTRRPMAPIGEHYAYLFAWLIRRFGKRLWIERSAASLGRIGQLLAVFPNARFIHLVRDGRDVAISMHREARFRIAHALGALARVLGCDPFYSADRSNIANVPAALRRFLPEQFEMGALGDYEVPLHACGSAWSQQIVSGLSALGALPAERVLTLRYEDFFLDPPRQLHQFAAFLGREFENEAWYERCTALIGAPRSSHHDIPRPDWIKLQEACRPGFDALRSIELDYGLPEAAGATSGG